MDAPNSPRLSLKVPLLTFVMAGGAVAATFIPDCSRWLIYDRPAILSGQIWRMFTGQWVHFSTRHLVYDLIAWCAAGTIIEMRGLPRFGWFCFLTPWAVSTALLVFEPQMTFCGGLSGLAVAAFVYLSVGGLGDPLPWRWVWVAVLAGLTAKVIFEDATGRSFLDTLDSTTVAVSVTSHEAGAATALLFYLIAKPPRCSTTAWKGPGRRRPAGPVHEEPVAQYDAESTRDLNAGVRTCRQPTG